MARTRRTGVRLAFAALLATAVAGAFREAHALDQPLGGKRLVVRTGARDRVVLVTRDRIEAPAPRWSDDPRVQGAVLEVGNPTSGEWARVELPAAGWTGSGEGTDFRFRSPEPRSARPSVRRARLHQGKRLRIRARDVGFTLDESHQDTLAVVL